MITIIVAVSRNNVIGREGGLAWKLRGDLRRFKALTTGHVIVMGRKTFESLPKMLPNRTHVVASRNRDDFGQGVIVAKTMEEAIEKGKKIDDNVFVIGGGEIYRQAMKMADVIEITRVEADVEGDTFFEEIDMNTWEKTMEERHEREEGDDYDYTFERYQRR